MKNIQVFDPALCCSSGVCGVEVDQALVGRYPRRAELARWAGIKGLGISLKVEEADCCSGGSCC